MTPPPPLPPPQPAVLPPSRVLVAGSTGWLGQALVAELLGRGYKVTALARDPDSSAAQELRSLGASLAEGDVTSPPSLERAMAATEGEPSTVVSAVISCVGMLVLLRPRSSAGAASGRARARPPPTPLLLPPDASTSSVSRSTRRGATSSQGKEESSTTTISTTTSGGIERRPLSRPTTGRRGRASSEGARAEIPLPVPRAKSASGSLSSRSRHLDAAVEAGVERAAAQTCLALLSGKPGGLFLDVKSAYSSAEDVQMFAGALSGLGIHVKGVLSFNKKQVNNAPALFFLLSFLSNFSTHSSSCLPPPSLSPSSAHAAPRLPRRPRRPPLPRPVGPGARLRARQSLERGRGALQRRVARAAARLGRAGPPGPPPRTLPLAPPLPAAPWDFWEG